MLNSHPFADGPLEIRDGAAACHGELIGNEGLEHETAATR